MTNGTRSVEVKGSSNGRLTVVLDRDIEPQDVLAALREEVAEPRPADPDAFSPAPVRRSSRPYAGEFLG
jgi:hypothetical protein